MDTPVPPDPGGGRILYGFAEKSINRRTIMAGLASALACPALARGSGVRAIGWSASAMVFDGPRVFDLTLRTRVEPFRRARSTSWITREGEGAARTLVIEPDSGWLERGGKREELAPALIAHERQQYGLYGYLLGAPARPKERTVAASEPGFPPIRIEIDRGRLVSADYAVASADGAQQVPQHITFAGEIREKGVRWFQQMTIEQAGRRYLQMWINDFTVERG
jgi:hypothetical protein